MALDLFQTPDMHLFWVVFSGTTVVTYIAAVFGFLWVYWEAVMGWLMPKRKKRWLKNDHMVRIHAPNHERTASQYGLEY
jgi:hypothetical protein